MTHISHRCTRQFLPQYLHAPKGVKPCQTNKPLYLEIGAGKGKHALLFAQQNPESHLVAVERTSHKFGVFDQRHQDQSLQNLDVVHADALAYCSHFIGPATLSGVFILYPNPEPHNKNQRWLNMPFFEFLLSRLKAGASIVLASNIEAYIDEACQLLEDVWLLPYTKHTIAANSARTHFEIKYLARSEHCQELVITKPAGYRTRFDDFSALSL